MNFCPNCRYEYDENVKKCPDCGAELVEELPPEKPEFVEEHIELVEIFSGPSLVAMMLQEALKDREIASIIQPREPLAGVLGERAIPPYSAVMVSDLDARERSTDIDECLAMITEASSTEEPGE